MRIAQVAPSGSPVLPVGAGSVELVTWLLADEMTRAGHDVTTFAIAGSKPAGTLVETMPGPYASPGTPDDWHITELMSLSAAVARSGDFDVLHTHAYLWGLAFEPFARCPMVHTTHVLPGNDQAELRRAHPAARVVGLSAYQWSAFPDLQPAAVIPHGIDPSAHTFRATADDHLLFFGRFTAGKGPLDAIAVARDLGLRLVLAAPRNAYYDEVVAPHVDGDAIVYAGSPDAAARDALLAGALALVYPVRHPEPFGLVMVEAMMSGTPVAATPLGAVPEIVDEGVTGALGDHGAGLADAVRRCLELDRTAVRARAEQRFSAARMARDHVALYERLG